MISTLSQLRTQNLGMSSHAAGLPSRLPPAGILFRWQLHRWRIARWRLGRVPRVLVQPRLQCREPLLQIPQLPLEPNALLLQPGIPLPQPLVLLAQPDELCQGFQSSWDFLHTPTSPLFASAASSCADRASDPIFPGRERLPPGFHASPRHANRRESLDITSVSADPLLAQDEITDRFHARLLNGHAAAEFHARRVAPASAA